MITKLWYLNNWHFELDPGKTGGSDGGSSDSGVNPGGGGTTGK